MKTACSARRGTAHPIRARLPVQVTDAADDEPGGELLVQFHEQAIYHPGTGLPGLPPGKHPTEPVRRQRSAAIIGHGCSSGCRIIVVFHKPIMSAAAAPGPRLALDLRKREHGHELQLPY